MTRTLLATATALFAAITFTSAAQACISCEYTPEVVNTPVYSHSDGYYERKRVRTVKRVIRAARKIIVESDSEPRKVEKAASIEPTPVEQKAETENSTISTASVDKNEPVSIKEAAADEPKVSKNVGCKKFFPTVGMTLTVPCE